MVAVSPGTFFPPRCFAETPAAYCDNSSVAAIATHWRLAMIQSAVLIDHNIKADYSGCQWSHMTTLAIILLLCRVVCTINLFQCVENVVYMSGCHQ